MAPSSQRLEPPQKPGRFSLVERESSLYLRQQVLLQELGDLGALGVHDAIEAEVEVGLVELEQLL
ncbi:MAG: hypothetical protein Q8K96_15815, partial [Rubrivivax sp.]|nr:hypothetical protein [Rubrivivax sp.]